jgi:thiol-disulfide isomerase/thioredoxin
MKNILTILLFSILFLSFKKQPSVDIEFVAKHFNERICNIDKVQYNVRNIMTFIDGTVWDNKGFAVIEREQNDTIFGFSFYGIRNDINKSAIYKDNIGFQISNDSKSFKQEKGVLQFLGCPGGQMIYKDFFKLDTIYKSVEVTETDSCYIINYIFEDDLKNNVINRRKILELNKTTFLPKKVTTSFETDLGNKQTVVYIFDNLKSNEDIVKSVNEYIKELNEFELIKDEEQKPSDLLNKSLPSILLKNILNESETVEIKTNQLTLIDFWEIWCGWCIKSFPDVEKIKNKYQKDLLVVGIVTQDKENALKLIEKKGTTFLNLIGNSELTKKFNVTSWPRYFLVDKNGIIRREYFGFSEQIEKDIVEFINK